MDDAATFTIPQSPASSLDLDIDNVLAFIRQTEDDITASVMIQGMVVAPGATRAPIPIGMKLAPGFWARTASWIPPGCVGLAINNQLLLVLVLEDEAE